MKSRKTLVWVISLLTVVISSAGVISRKALMAARPIVIADVAPGDVIEMFEAHTASNGSTPGYKTYIPGYDGDYFSSTTTKNETTAYFTYVNVSPTPPVQIPSRRETLQRGSLTIDQGNAFSSPPSVVRIYFQVNPHGDYTKPETFSDGLLVAEFAYLGAYQSVTDTRDGYRHAIRAGLTQMYAGTFTINGKAYTYGKVGNVGTINTITAPDPNNPALLDYAGIVICTRAAQ
jgi:hypothetical protein